MFEPLSPQELAKVNQLADIFTRIGDERMKDIGLYNHALKVEVVGFRPWEGWLAGILVTPWFMNFMLLPTTPDQLSEADVTAKRRIEMPCGEVVFTVGEVEEFGPYMASSLYSPMGRFDVHAMAVTNAWAAVNKFFKVPEVEEPGGLIKP
ncbi:[NiFe]-hydrogenase assembly chaperone HybE [Magnetospirillum sulfuroxidans]|uniref:[NiFe]-hydrogenase assembly chaperone HybE n=1 Tax=Magnetospirillum sulfuroxidans TaxID=611300 RepID=A0ABS5I7T6_9PROT|nr:[NiFe]-hydrogenase assembly chaperone HybE [Magnetospirillum sulfuroxidans]MBR9970487.1 [NiFe]-hydrogenase assembly chaperone HybE [Magnetospirillum sulfuroxidans]